MRLINCPVCGTRCSADAEKCPECGYEIKNYFNNEQSIKKAPKYKLSFILFALFVVILLIVTIILIPKIKSSISTETTPEESAVTISTTIEPQANSSESTVTSDITSNIPIDVSGVYSGDDHEILVLNSDGLAYYYCVSIEFTELECPWYVIDNKVFIDLARLHCTISADINEKELLFKSDSINWNTELFTRLSVSPDDYLTRALVTHDPAATLNHDGTMTYSLDGIIYTIPKTFIDMEDEFDDWDYCSAFIDNDPQSSYAATLLFVTATGTPLTEESASTLVTTFAPSFFDNVSVKSCSPTTIADYKAYLCEVDGYLNKGFSELQGYAFSGYIAVLYNENTGRNDFIMMMQNSDRIFDNTDIFRNLLHNAYTE